MSFSKTHMLLILLTLSLLSLTNGALKKSTMDFNGFTGIRTCTGINVKILPTPTNSKEQYYVEVMAESDVLKSIKFNVINEILSLDFKGDFKTFDKIKITVFLPSEKLKSIENYDVSTIAVGEGFDTEKLKTFTKGSGKIIIKDIKVEKLDIKAINMAEVAVEGKIKDAQIKSTNSAIVYVGDVDKVKATATKLGLIYLFGPVSMKVKGKSSSLGEIYTNNKKHKCDVDSSQGYDFIGFDLSDLSFENAEKGCKKHNLKKVPEFEMNWTCGFSFSGKIKCVDIKESGSGTSASASSSSSSGGGDGISISTSSSSSSSSSASHASASSQSSSTGYSSSSSSKNNKDSAYAVSSKIGQSDFKIKSLKCKIKDKKTLIMF